MTKYQAIEQATSMLYSAGYDLKDEVYQALVKERAELEYPKPNPAYDMLKAKQEAAASRVRIRIVPMNSMYPIHSK